MIGLKLEHIDIEKLQKIHSDSDKQKIESMTKEEQDSYLLKYNMYRKLFTKFIIQKTNLKEYDKQIENSGLKFQTTKEEDMDIYQYFSSDELKYFYIRNNIYIEKLNEEEEKYLQDKIKSKNSELDDDTKKFIENTYEKVIFEDVLKNGETCITMYGPDSKTFMAPNNALVIGIRYDEFADQGLNDEEWEELHDKQILFLGKLYTNMYAQLKEKLNIPISIIRYTEYSITK